ncbi:MAG: hypothetical protein GY799_13370 [Desulfobulbaceae bacterium]|nr:hypothetical protein [Desulfobulbaceae bacterium]
MRQKHRRSKESHKKYIQRKCASKARFKTRKEAAGMAGQVGKNSRQDLVEYPCEICGGWHYGHRKTPFRVWMLTSHRRETGASR